MKNKLLCLLKELALIIMYFALSFGLQLLFFNQLTSSNVVIANIFYLLIELIILIIFIFLFRHLLLKDFKDFLKNGKKYLADNFPFYLLGFILLILTNGIISSFIGVSINEELNEELLASYTFYSVITILFIGPLVEELLTRVILKKDFHKYTYIFLSGFIFGLLHVIMNLDNNLIELLYIIPYGIMGSTLALIYSNSNNVWTNITFHFIHNLFGLIVIFL